MHLSCARIVRFLITPSTAYHSRLEQTAYPFSGFFDVLFLRSLLFRSHSHHTGSHCNQCPQLFLLACIVLLIVLICPAKSFLPFLHSSFLFHWNEQAFPWLRSPIPLKSLTAPTVW